MVARITTFAFDGVEAQPVDVQVQLAGGQVTFMVVGLPDKAVGESRERVRAAFAALGLALPPKRVIVNLAPADLPKEGIHYDLAIALAMLAMLGVLPEDQLAKYAAIGELSLDGRLIETAGVLPAAMAAEAMGLSLICPGGVRCRSRMGRRRRASGTQPDRADQPFRRPQCAQPAEEGRPAGSAHRA